MLVSIPTNRKYLVNVLLSACYHMTNSLRKCKFLHSLNKLLSTQRRLEIILPIEY